MRFFRLPVLLLGAALTVSCFSGPETIPDTIAPEKLVQQAQEASDRNRYRQALVYYEVILERFSGDTAYVCAAEYEIGFIHYKQKKYELAETELRKLLAQYDHPDAELLPPQYKILANIILTRLDERKLSTRRWPLHRTP
jgi:outer membrane protein assembly factor BamD (BamD/ComL family)